MVLVAFDAESRRLAEVMDGLDEASFGRPSPCVPWTTGELLFHVQMTVERLGGMLAEPEPAGSGLVTASGYYRADERFSAAVNDDRVAVGAARRGGPVRRRGACSGVPHCQGSRLLAGCRGVAWAGGADPAR